MDSNSHKFREMDNIQLNDTIVATSSCSEMFSVVTLDDTVTIWKNSFSPFNKQPIHTIAPSATGIVDAQFSNDASQLAISSMDSLIRVVDLASKEISSIECPVMSSWKLAYLNESIVTCGDLGSVAFFDRKSKEQTKKLQAGQIFLTCMAKSNSEAFLAMGNNNGEASIFHIKKKDENVSLKPHHKMIRSIAFTEDSSKVITASDDTTIKVIDIASQKVSSSLEGHKQAVSCVRTHPNDSRFLFSCSHDKSIRSWDLRMNSYIDSFQTGSSLWSLEVFPKNLVAGGQNGVLSLYSIE